MPHHVTQRGNRHENVFFNDEDRAAYLKWLGEYAAARRVGIAAYCLMTIGEKAWRPIFLDGLKATLGRRVIAQPRGRKPKDAGIEQSST